MVDLWKCVKCGELAYSGVGAGDHERRYYDVLAYYPYDEWGLPLHYMDRVDE